ncbi:MAG: hypothetical protein QM504_06495 [Pseudomonadota bacterium]
MKKQTYEEMVETLEHEAELIQKRDNLESDSISVKSRVDSLERELLESKHRAESYKATYERSKQERDKPDYINSEAALNNTLNELTNRRKELQQIVNKMTAIAQELDSLNAGTSITHAQEHQNKINSIKDECSHYQQMINVQNQVISDHEHIVEQANQPTEEINLLLQQKEVLLLDIAEGQAQQSEFIEVENKLDTLTTQKDKIINQSNKLIKQAKQTIVALSNKMASPQSELKYRENLTDKITSKILIIEANKIASDYEAITQEMLNKIFELAAIDKMIADFGVVENTTRFDSPYWLVQFPIPNTLKNADNLLFEKKKVRFKNAQGDYYMSYAWISEEVKEVTLKLKEKLIKHGISFSQL